MSNENEHSDPLLEAIERNRSRTDKIMIERAKKENMETEIKEFLESLKRKYYVTDKDLAQLVKKISKQYNH